MGYLSFENGEVVPTTPGWAKVWVESEKSIPESWRSLFYDELASEDDQYRKDLERSINQHGVRWS